MSERITLKSYTKHNLHNFQNVLTHKSIHVLKLNQLINGYIINAELSRRDFTRLIHRARGVFVIFLNAHRPWWHNIYIWVYQNQKRPTGWKISSEKHSRSERGPIKNIYLLNTVLKFVNSLSKSKLIEKQQIMYTFYKLTPRLF